MEFDKNKIDQKLLFMEEMIFMYVEVENLRNHEIGKLEITHKDIKPQSIRKD